MSANASAQRSWWTFLEGDTRPRRYGRSAAGPVGDGSSMEATTRPAATSSRGGSVKSTGLARLTRTILVVCVLAAPAVVRGIYMEAPAAKHVRTMVGCTPQVMMHPTVSRVAMKLLVWETVWLRRFFWIGFLPPDSSTHHTHSNTDMIGFTRTHTRTHMHTHTRTHTDARQHSGSAPAGMVSYR